MTIIKAGCLHIKKNANLPATLQYYDICKIKIMTVSPRNCEMQQYQRFTVALYLKCCFNLLQAVHIFTVLHSFCVLI